MDQITGAQLLKLLSSRTALDVAWQVKQVIPPVPLEIWIEILCHCEPDTARNLLTSHELLHQHVESSRPARSRLLRVMVKRIPFYYGYNDFLRENCWAWGLGNQAVISCYIRRKHRTNKLTLYVPHKPWPGHHHQLQYKAIIRTDREDSAYVLFPVGQEEERRIEFTQNGRELVFSQEQLPHCTLRFCDVTYQRHSGTVEPSQLTAARALAAVLQQLKPWLAEYHLKPCATRVFFKFVESVIREEFDFGAVVTRLP